MKITRISILKLATTLLGTTGLGMTLTIQAASAELDHYFTTVSGAVRCIVTDAEVACERTSADGFPQAPLTPPAPGDRTSLSSLRQAHSGGRKATSAVPTPSVICRSSTESSATIRGGPSTRAVQELASPISAPGTACS